MHSVHQAGPRLSASADTRTIRRVAIIGIAVLALGSTAMVEQGQDEQTFVPWAQGHAATLNTIEPGPGVADLAPFKAIVGPARVVALGEAAHGAHEPLALRNRLFACFVNEMGFTAIALESGLPEARRVEAFVAGGPGTVRDIVRRNVTWGFGRFQENEELVEWMRVYNANPAHVQKLHFYGIDLSLGGPQGTTPTMSAIDDVLSYLARVDEDEARRAVAVLDVYRDALSGRVVPPMSPAVHDSLSSAVDGLVSRLEAKRASYVAASSTTDYDWALREATVARQADRAFRLTLPSAPGGSIPPGAWRAMNAREAAMADNVSWIRDRHERVLVYAHDSHVKNSRTEDGAWRNLERPPDAMGQYLRAILGDDLVIVGTVAGANAPNLPAVAPDPNTVETVLARVGPRSWFLDLRGSRGEPAAAAWLAGRHSLRVNFTSSQTLSLTPAFDVLVYFDMFTTARVTP
jgi:erythromycin esterase